MDTIKNLKNDVVDTLNVTLLKSTNGDSINDNYQTYLLFKHLLRVVIGWLRPLIAWRDRCNDVLYRRKIRSELIKEYSESRTWKMHKLTDVKFAPTLYFKIPELSHNGDSGEWFSTNLFDYVNNSFEARNSKDVIEVWRNNAFHIDGYDIYESCRRLIETLNTDNLLSIRTKILSFEVRIIWFFFSENCAISKLMKSDNWVDSVSTPVFGRLTDEQMTKQLHYNRRIIPDYNKMFNADEGTRATSKQFASLNYRINEDDNVIRVFSYVSPSSWYSILLQYAIRVCTDSLITPKGTLRKVRIDSAVSAGSRINNYMSRNFNVSRFLTFEQELNSFISSRTCAPMLIEPITNFWLKFRDCLINGMSKKILGERNHAYLTTFQKEDEYGKGFAHTNLATLQDNPKDVDLLLSRMMKDIREGNSIGGLTININQLTMKYHSRTPKGDRLDGIIPLDYEEVGDLNGYYPITLNLSFRGIEKLMRGLTISRFSENYSSVATSNSDASKNAIVAFNRTISATHQITRFVDEWADEENDHEGEKYGCHPFIDGDSLCFEQYAEPINASFSNGDIIGFLFMLKQWLSTYTSQSNPYRPISDFIFGATEKNKTMLSTNLDDGSIREFHRFSPDRCHSMYYPPVSKCVEIGCVFASLDESNKLSVPNFRERTCSHIKYNFDKYNDEQKRDIFGIIVDEKLLERNKEEMRKVEALIANKLTKEAQDSDGQIANAFNANFNTNQQQDGGNNE